MKNKKTNNNNFSRGAFWGKIVAVSLAVCTLFGALFAGASFMTDGFTKMDPSEWFERDINPDNLIKRDDYVEALPEETEGGLSLDWRKNGSVRISGKLEESNPSDSFYRVVFTDVTLPAGKYTLSCGNDKANTNTFGLRMEYNLGAEKQSIDVGAEDFTFELDSETTVVLSIFVAKNERFYGINSFINPILVSEGQTVSFYK